MKNRMREVTDVEMSIVAAVAILLVMVVKMVTGAWFFLPLVPALVLSLFAAMTLVRDKEWRFEGIMFFLLGSVLLLTAILDFFRFGF